MAAYDCARYVRIDTAHPGAPLPRYGAFFVDYNHGGDGGLYAELVRNRSFEDADTPEAWQMHGDGVTMELDRDQPLNQHNPTALYQIAPYSVVMLRLPIKEDLTT